MPLPAVSLEPPRRTTWQIKVSTLCNLRCRYCYEWERLDDPRRMSLPAWRRLLEVIREHRRQRLREEGAGLVTTIVWHGGEPLLQPPAYVRAVLALQRDVLGIESAGIRNAVQTNLTRAGETLSVMIDAGFLLSVSADFAVGVRVDAAGCDSEARVTAHMERLAGTSASWGVALVLGHHNRERLREIHDALRSMGAAWLRIHPMYAPPSGAPGHALQLADDEVFNALRGLEAGIAVDDRFPAAVVLGADLDGAAGCHGALVHRAGRVYIGMRTGETPLRQVARVASLVSVLGKVLIVEDQVSEQGHLFAER